MLPGRVNIGHKGTIVLPASTAEPARRFRLDTDTADGPLGLVVVERHTEITHEESDAGLQSLQTLD